MTRVGVGLFRPSSVAVAAIALAFTACADSNSPSSSLPPAPQASLGSTIDALTTAELQQSGVPGMTVAIAKNGTILYAHGYGKANLAAQTPAQANDVYEIGSITKQFTAVLIMKLQEQGQLHVDDRVADYLTGYG